MQVKLKQTHFKLIEKFTHGNVNRLRKLNAINTIKT